MMKKLLLIPFLCSLPLLATSHWSTKEQVAQYVHYSDLQRRSTWHLLSQVHFRGDEKVLDVGCGDGRNTAMMARMAREGAVHGIDPSSAMLDWAHKQYHPEEYSNLTFGTGDALHLPDEKYDLITAFFSFHLVKDKESAAQVFYNHLLPGGEVIATLPPHPRQTPEFFDALQETMEALHWRFYFADFKPTFHFTQVDEYEAHFEGAGFSEVEALYIPSVDPFVNREEFANWFIGTWPHFHYLPASLRKTFAFEVLDRYKKKCPHAVTKEGVYHFHWGHYELRARQ